MDYHQTVKFEFVLFLILTIWYSAANSRNLDIVGGVPALKGEFPWMTSLQYRNPKIHLCGATIINSTFLVTGGHCVNGYEASDLQVMAGTLNIVNIEATQQIRNVVRISIHPGFQNTELKTRNDIALLEIQPAFVMNQYVNSIPLPESRNDVQGFCWIAGWGQTETAPSSDILLKASLPIVSKNDCEAVYNERLDKENQICAGFAHGGTDACVGDTGGPLVCNNTGTYYLAGITSWGYKCASPNYPGVYTETSFYTERRDEEPHFVISM